MIHAIISDGSGAADVENRLSFIRRILRSRRKSQFPRCVFKGEVYVAGLSGLPVRGYNTGFRDTSRKAFRRAVMPFDLFVSYSRRDNAQDRVSQLVEQIRTDYREFAGRELNPFFDVAAILGMQDWRHRILQGLRESRMFLLCLSPNYLESEYCAWEFAEYLKHEIAQFGAGEGIAPIYFVDVPGWSERGFDEQRVSWVAELRRRQAFDLRPWYDEGKSALRDAAIRERLQTINRQLDERIRRIERAERNVGNTDAHNPRFVGRILELRRLREKVALERIGAIAIIHGLGGIGKTSLAMEYAQAFSHEYGGGRWQVRCEGKSDLRLAIAELSSALGIEFGDDEKRDPQRQFERVLQGLQRFTEAGASSRCLLILDNVDQPALLATEQRRHLPAADWFHLIATTRLGPGILVDLPAESFASVDELPDEDALALLQANLPPDRFAEECELVAARAIVRRLDGFPLALETTAVFLAEYPDVSCQAFLRRMETEGLSVVDRAATESAGTLRHGEKRLSASLAATWERLNGFERHVVAAASLLPPDHIPLPWLRELLGARFPEFAADPGPGYPSPWHGLLRRLAGLRLLQSTSAKDAASEVLVVKMHRLVQEALRPYLETLRDDIESELMSLTLQRAVSYSSPLEWGDLDSAWELSALTALAHDWLARPDGIGVKIAAEIARPLLGRHATYEADALIRPALEHSRAILGDRHAVTATCLIRTAHLLRECDRAEEALTFAEQALTVDLELFGLVHERIARDRNELALGYHALQRFSLAEQSYQQALLSLPECPSGPSNVGLLSVLVRHNLADLHQSAGLFEQAAAEFHAVLTDLEAQLGAGHPFVATAWNNLAVNFHNSRQNASAAEAAYRRALSLFEKSLGLNHARVAKTWHHFGMFYLATGRYDEAVDPLRKAQAILESELAVHRTAAAQRRYDIRSDLLTALIGSGCSNREILVEPGFGPNDLPEIRRRRWRRWTHCWRRYLRPFLKL